MDERKRFIEEWHRSKESFADVCRAYGISRKTGYKWVDRFRLEGLKGLEEVSRAPHGNPQAICEVQAEAIVRFRQEHPSWGARKIREYFRREQPQEKWPAASSIHALLHSRGLTMERKRRRKTPPYTQPLEHATAANDVWCADFKGWFRCGDGTRCDPLTVTDAWSRYLLRCHIVSKTDGVHVRAVFETLFRQCGMPAAIRTDNGPPFASPAPAGLSRLSMWWLQLGIRHERIEPGHPEQNGPHERMHRTLKEETATPPAPNLRRQQKRFDQFGRSYNCERPHEGIHYRTPSQLWVPSNREFPCRLPELQYPEGVHLRRISQQGSLKWKTCRTFISEVLARRTVGLLEIDDDLFEVYYGPLLIGWFEGRGQVFLPEQRPSGKRHKRTERAASGVRVSAERPPDGQITVEMAR